jgi:hypothetical protein
MINFDAMPIISVLYLLSTWERDASLHENVASIKADPRPNYIDDEKKKEIGLSLMVCKHVGESLESTSIIDRIQRFDFVTKGAMTWAELHAEARALRQSFEDALKRQHFYRYPPSRYDLLNRVDIDWVDVFTAFESTKDDAWAATDCLALGHGTASVFYLMRVLEKGLNALAVEVGRDFERQQWNTIIEGIECDIKNYRKTTPKSAERDDRIKFLSEAAKEFMYFKDGWRNYVSHSRTSYDPDQALGTLHHVRAFMSVLSTRLSEAGAP